MSSLLSSFGVLSLFGPAYFGYQHSPLGLVIGWALAVGVWFYVTNRKRIRDASRQSERYVIDELERTTAQLSYSAPRKAFSWCLTELVGFLPGTLVGVLVPHLAVYAIVYWLTA